MFGCLCFVVFRYNEIDVMVLKVEMVVVSEVFCVEIVDILCVVMKFGGFVEFVIFGVLLNDGKVIVDEC